MFVVVPWFWYVTSTCGDHGKQRGTHTWKMGNFLWNLPIEDDDLRLWVSSLALTVTLRVPKIALEGKRVLRHRPHYSEKHKSVLPARGNATLPRVCSQRLIPHSKLYHFINCTAVRPCSYFWLTSISETQGTLIKRRFAGYTIKKNKDLPLHQR